MAAIDLPHDLTALGCKGWFASAVYHRPRYGSWVHTFAYGRNGLILEAEAGTPADALLGMLKRIETVNALMKPRRHKSAA